MQHRILTGHHANCQQGPALREAAIELIRKLVKGMENWAADEDGVHPEAWEAYKHGKAVLGQFDWKEDEKPADQGS